MTTGQWQSPQEARTPAGGSGTGRQWCGAGGGGSLRGLGDSKLMRSTCWIYYFLVKSRVLPSWGRARGSTRVGSSAHSGQQASQTDSPQEGAGSQAGVSRRAGAGIKGVCLSGPECATSATGGRASERNSHCDGSSCESAGLGHGRPETWSSPMLVSVGCFSMRLTPKSGDWAEQLSAPCGGAARHWRPEEVKG